MQLKLFKHSYVLCALLLAGCSVGPDYKPVVLQTPQKYKEVPAGWKLADPQDALEKGSWWKMFKDPCLDNLMAQVKVSNQNIAVAVAQFKEAVATLDQTSAAFWPTIAGNGSGTRQKNGGGSNNFNNSSSSSSSSSGSSNSGSINGNYTADFSASWAPDIFGVVRRAVEAATAGAQASAAQVAETTLSMQALLAQTYFQLRGADLKQQLLDETVEAYRKDLALTKNKYAAGTISRLDVTQAETQLQNAQTAALDNGISRAQYEHAIAVLIGKYPENFAITTNNKQLYIPPVPMELPSILLERRPDIAAAERSIAQANANIGVAIAAYFPVVTLTSTYGYSSNALNSLFSTPSIMWSLGAAIAETIFDGGARAAQVRLARATYEQMLAAYKQTVLAAFQNVEDNLVAVRILDSEVAVQEGAVRTAKKALEITLNQYHAGIVEYINVIIEQTTAFNTEEVAIDIYSRRLVSTVALIQALGGGWDRSAIANLPDSDCEDSTTIAASGEKSTIAGQ